MSIPVVPTSGLNPTRAQRLAAWVNEKSTAGRQFTAGQYTITVVDDLVCTVTAGNKVAVTFNLKVERNGVDVTPAGLNPVTIVNPPMLVREADQSLTQSVQRAFRDTVLDFLRSFR